MGPTTTRDHIPMFREDRPQYFQDPAVDRLLQMFLELAAELWATKDWQHTVTTLLAQKGIVTQADIDRFAPPADVADKIAAEREMFVHRIVRHISGKAEPLKYE
jgi:hypothetical protein